MVAETTSARPSVLPATLAGSLHRIARRQRRLLLISALLRTTLVTLITGLICVFLLGGFASLSAAARWLVALAAWGSILGSCLWLLWPVCKPIALRHAAGLVEHNQPTHEERILCAVEFSESPDLDLLASRQMVEHVIAQAEQDARRIEPPRILSAGAVKRWSLYCLPALLAWCVLWPLMPRTVAAGLVRTFAPWKNSILSAPAHLQVSPGNAAIAAGDSLSVYVKDYSARSVGTRARSAMNLAVRSASGAGQRIAMTPIGPNSFRYTFDRVRTSFRYRAAGRRGYSAWYAVRVIARPALTNLELRYIYPAYSRLPVRKVTGLNGRIRALAGSRVRVRIHTTQPLILHAPRPPAAEQKSSLDIAASGGVQGAVLPLRHVRGLVYQATLHVRRDTTYRIHLLNHQGVANRDDHSWPIIALPDAPPVIHITSPGKIRRVRPKDVVPVDFKASDDFGLTSIKAIVSVGYPRGAGISYRIAMPPGPNPTEFHGQWNLSVARQLPAAGRGAAARIYYRLQATDNRTPRRQKSRTSLHELIVDRNLQVSYRQRRDSRVYHALRRALEESIRHVNRAGGAVRSLQRILRGKKRQKLNQSQKRQADMVQRKIARAAAKLTATADHYKHGAYADVAAAARRVARRTMRSAANQVARAVFENSQRAPSRIPELNKAETALTNAQQKLANLVQQLHHQARQRQILDTLRNLAGQQRRLSRQLAVNPHSPQAINQQKKIQQRLEKLLGRHKTLQTPAAARVAGLLSKLRQSVDKIITTQSAADHTIQQQMRRQAARKQLTQLAHRQQRINQEINHFEMDRRSLLQATGTIPPTPPALQAAVDNLQARRYAAALANQRWIASTLHKIGGRLTQLAQPPSPAMQKAHQIALNNQKQAQRISQRATALPQQPAGETHQRMQAQAIAGAQAMRALAQRMLNEAATPTVHSELQSAMEQCDQAINAANDRNWRQTSRSLAAAGGNLQNAAQQQAQATALSPVPGQAAAAGKKARQLEQQQRLLAEKTAAMARLAAHAPQSGKENATQQFSGLSGKISAASQIARKIQQQSAQGSPDLAARVVQSRRQMLQARRAQQDAAKALAANQHALARRRQQAALTHMQLALRALNSLSNSPEIRNLARYRRGLARGVRPGATPPSPAGAPPKRNGPPISSDPLMAAARQIYHAMKAQNQTLSGNPTAARQAAQALHQAFSAMSQAGGKGMSNKAGAPGSHPLLAAGAHGNLPGQPGELTARPSGNVRGNTNGTPPKALQEMGILPAQWRNLGPLVQKQLLATARQEIPPGYRRMVRDYYLRIARLPSQ